jgi:hypothetical protein
MQITSNGITSSRDLNHNFLRKTAEVVVLGRRLSRYSPSDNLARCLTILMRVPTLLNLLDPLRRLCLLSSLDCSSGYCLSARLDG